MKNSIFFSRWWPKTYGKTKFNLEPFSVHFFLSTSRFHIRLTTYNYGRTLFGGGLKGFQCLFIIPVTWSMQTVHS